jgi:hypothetical protein
MPRGSRLCREPTGFPRGTFPTPLLPGSRGLSTSVPSHHLRSPFPWDWDPALEEEEETAEEEEDPVARGVGSWP